MDDILHRPLPFMRPVNPKEFNFEVEMFHPAKMRSVSTSTPILTRDMLNKTPKVTRSMSTGNVNDSGFDESFNDSLNDNTLCINTPSTVCKNELLTPITSHHARKYCDSGLNQSYGPCPFSVKVNRFFETPGASFFSAEQNEFREPVRKKCRRQSLSVPSLRLDFESEMCQEKVVEHHDDSGVTSSTISFETSSLVEKFEEVMQKFSPAHPEKVIGRKMGVDHIDIIAELSNRNISCSQILQYLEPADLCRMCEVSQQWQKVCNEDPVSRKRKRSGILERSVRGKTILHRNTSEIKENIGKRSPPKHLRGLTDSQQTLAPLQPTAKMSTPASIRVDLFQKAAADLKNEEKLRKCPKCSKVSKVLPVQDRGQCLNSDCLFDFCTKCFYSFHGSKPCTPVATKKTKTDSICGKKSKKNLRRL